MNPSLLRVTERLVRRSISLSRQVSLFGQAETLGGVRRRRALLCASMQYTNTLLHALDT